MTGDVVCGRGGRWNTPLLPGAGGQHKTPVADLHGGRVIQAGEPVPAPRLFLPASGRWLELAPLPFVVGSGEGCDLRIAGSGLSRRHAVFEAGAGCYRVKDLCSRAGLRVNGQPVRRVALAEGDRLHLAGIEMIFVVGRAALPAVIVPRQRHCGGQRWRARLSVVLALSLAVGYGGYRFQSRGAGAEPHPHAASATAGVAQSSGRWPQARHG
ncbi:MAG: FHA domain-containing protein, partial [Gammaproteobacteria bacterium]|nr:FHA domain-containing protein [Gammaproteobacteria bacterium]